MDKDASLQELFLRGRGEAVFLGEDRVIQLDRVPIPEEAIVTVTFIGDQVFVDNAAVLAIAKTAKSGKIFLSDGSAVRAVTTWDQIGFPRTVRHRVLSGGQPMDVFNKYRIRHRSGLITEDNFTGNAGMVVNIVSSNKRHYECSNGPGPFSKNALVFDVSWEAVLHAK
jgi:hypothetical protein